MDSSYRPINFSSNNQNDFVPSNYRAGIENVNQADPSQNEEQIAVEPVGPNPFVAHPHVVAPAKISARRISTRDAKPPERLRCEHKGQPK